MTHLLHGKSLIVLVALAAAAVNAALPRVLAGAAGTAAERDEQDCHEARRPTG